MKMISPVGPKVGGKKIEIICMSDVPGIVLLCFTIPSSLIFVYAIQDAICAFKTP